VNAVLAVQTRFVEHFQWLHGAYFEVRIPPSSREADVGQKSSLNWSLPKPESAYPTPEQVYLGRLLDIQGSISQIHDVRNRLVRARPGARRFNRTKQLVATVKELAHETFCFLEQLMRFAAAGAELITDSGASQKFRKAVANLASRIRKKNKTLLSFRHYLVHRNPQDIDPFGELEFSALGADLYPTELTQQFVATFETHKKLWTEAADRMLLTMVETLDEIVVINKSYVKAGSFDFAPVATA
jgi:hypothetical protein